MAEECVSVEFEDGKVINYCWEDVTPYQGWNYENVRTGLHPGLAGGARSFRTCQYFLKGLPSVCKFWKENGGDESAVTFFCSYVDDNTSDNPLDPPAEIPTGFNNSNCDFLGRRGWCSKYEQSKDYDPNEWICTAPNPYLTGLGAKQLQDRTATFTNVTRDNIWGYNDAEDGTGTGKCDCAGMGRGAEGCKLVGDFTGSTTLEMEKRLSKLPILCNWYRPFSLGFGIIDPSLKEKDDLEVDGITITDEGWKRAQEWEDNVPYRLPLNYLLYNVRAQYQKCQWWEEETNREYFEDGQGNIYLDGAPEIFDEGTGRVEFCKCPHTAADPYNHRVLTSGSPGWETGSQLALDGVWARGGGPVCNGARPECPCYTGNWVYLTQEHMYPGMPVTANQILELRFWESDWDTQEEYDEYYKQKPNFDDPDTHAIYTFTKWTDDSTGTASNDALAGIDITKSKMVGKKLSLCQPAPLHLKEFSEEYIDILEDPVTYWYENIGTSTEGEQRHFPNLIRNPEFKDIRLLTVVYPNYNNDPFNPEICPEVPPEPGYIKRSSSMEGDFIRTIGYTYINKTVYVINTKQIPVSDYIIKKFRGVYDVRGKKIKDANPDSIKGRIYNEIRRLISAGLAEDPDYIVSSTSDGLFGLFIIPPVKLVYNRDNDLLVCVDYGDGTWEYRWRPVKSKFYGGVVKQTSYEHKYGDSSGGYTNPAPQYIAGTGEAAGKATASLIPLGGCRNGVAADVISTFSLDNIVESFKIYDYTYQLTLNEDIPITFWGPVGNTNRVLVSLSDININYVYDWEIIDPIMTYIGSDAEKREEAGLPMEVEMEVVKSGNDELVDDNYIGEDYCVLKPKDDLNVRQKFISSKWQLSLTYGYLLPSNSYDPSKAVTWGGNNSESDHMVESPHNISVTDTSLEVSGITKGSVQILAHFKDENGRIICPFATKLMTQIVWETCRSVDIFYKYSVKGKKYQLNPLSGFCTYIEGDSATGEYPEHVEIPNCGDHEHSWYSWQGPMWFPFTICRGYDLYDEVTYCNNCQSTYVGPDNDGFKEDLGYVVKRRDYRYCGPYKYYAYGDPRGNWLASCDCGCKFYYSDATGSQPIFIGEGRVKGVVDLADYSEFSWYPPPFGNEGRETIQKFISQDYVTHLVPFVVDGVLQRSDWMPLMMDYDGFFAKFNAYDEDSEDEFIGISNNNGFEPFRYVHQMTMNILPYIGEEIIQAEGESVDDRRRWEDVFEVHHEGNCSYPLPTYPVSSSATKAIFYYLKQDWTAWAWQEAWKDIERNISDELPETSGPLEEGEEKITEVGKLSFIDIGKPRYVFDYHKTEHRRITDEGNHLIIYTGPVLDEDGNLDEYPTLSLDGANPRPFKILFNENEYSSEYAISFSDEGGQADTQSSSDEDNVYEEASGNDWLHEPNTLFDATAVSGTEEAKDAGREIVTGTTSSFFDIFNDYTYKYYNRGITANFTRADLYNLPKEKTSFEGEWDKEASTPQIENKTELLVPGLYVWKASADLVFPFANESGEGSVSISKISIKGSWGTSEGFSDAVIPRPTIHKIIKPGCSVSADFTDGSSGIPRGGATNLAQPEIPSDGMEMEEFTIDLYFLLGPVEMLQKKIKSFILSLEGRSDHYISLSSIEITTAVYIDVMYEHIKVWERKYIVSEFTDIAGQNINLDGADDNLQYDEDFLNMGQYYPFRKEETADQELQAVDKTKIIAAGVYHEDDEIIEELEYNTLHTIEANKQKDIYNYAIELDQTGDNLNYQGIVPYKFADFMDFIGENFPLNSLDIDSEKLIFEKHALSKQYVPYEFWRPGGHKYEWDTEYITRQRCLLFSAPSDVYRAKYLHVDHKGPGGEFQLPIDAGNKFYSGNFEIAKAKYDRAMVLAGGSPEFNDNWGVGGGSL